MKNRIAAGLFAIFLGGIGVHRFYLGQVGLGLIYVLFCWTGIPAIIGLVEGILILTMTDEQFRDKYELGVVVSTDNVLATKTVSAADEIKKYKDLYDSGAITQDEFEKKKKELLK
ncbi:MAG TPA: NINE protein [Bacillota bacterium]|nr:NINE protein [Bacillota bacterium]HPF42613.1 NINE protein [Bacillota bacterium]HPJ86238.1 NINE protein [Bacillota bacterium]HPQ62272.1 NINE protein [Bacillota bacterium]HRX92293.1 NINE protein [Candidatus Izemoplasmatales bacterium]